MTKRITDAMLMENQGAGGDLGMVNFLVTFFLGFLGIHRFMQKKYVTGFIWLFTCGLFGVGWFVDMCIAFSRMVKGRKDEREKKADTEQENPSGAGQAVQPQERQKGQQEAGQAAQRIQTGQTQPSGQAGDGEKKGFWADVKERAIKNRQEAAIRAAYKKEEEKRKPKIKKIRHTREFTPEERQTLDMLNMEIIKMESDYKNKRITDNSGVLRLLFQKKAIESRAEWYETIELPPEVDPDTPIYVDEEAIRNSITELF